MNTSTSTKSSAANPAAAANPVAKASSEPRRVFFTGQRLASIAFVFFLLLVAGIVYFQFASVSGLEMNAATWRIREFHFYREPFTNSQISGVKHNSPDYMPPWTPAVSTRHADINPAILKHLKKTDTVDRWDLATLSSATASGEAYILIELLSARNNDFDEYWVAWSNDEPTKAAVFWPAVQDLVTFEQYTKLPALFESTLAKTTQAEFEANVGKYVQDCLLQLASSDETKDPETLQFIAQVALKYGDNEELQQILESP